VDQESPDVYRLSLWCLFRSFPRYNPDIVSSSLQQRSRAHCTLDNVFIRIQGSSNRSYQVSGSPEPHILRSRDGIQFKIGAPAQTVWLDPILYLNTTIVNSVEACNATSWEPLDNSTDRAQINWYCEVVANGVYSKQDSSSISNSTDNTTLETVKILGLNGQNLAADRYNVTFEDSAVADIQTTMPHSRTGFLGLYKESSFFKTWLDESVPKQLGFYRPRIWDTMDRWINSIIDVGGYDDTLFDLESDNIIKGEIKPQNGIDYPINMLVTSMSLMMDRISRRLNIRQPLILLEIWMWSSLLMFTRPL
jgi:hypothetical protein